MSTLDEESLTRAAELQQLTGVLEVVVEAVRVEFEATPKQMSTAVACLLGTLLARRGRALDQHAPVCQELPAVALMFDHISAALAAGDDTAAQVH